MTDRPSDPKLRVVPELPPEEKTRPDSPVAFAEMLRIELANFDRECLSRIEESLESKLSATLSASLDRGIRSAFNEIQIWLSAEFSRSEGRIAAAVINALSPRISFIEISLKGVEAAHHVLRTEFDEHRGREHTELEMRLARAETTIEQLSKLLQPDTIPAPAED